MEIVEETKDTQVNAEALEQENLFRDYHHLFEHGHAKGDPRHERLHLKDAIATPNNTPMLRRVIDTIVRDSVEPVLIISKLFQTLRYEHGADIIQFPTLGALVAEDLGEGQEYPERSPSWGGSTMTASIGKVGLAIKVTDEMIRYSQFDIIGMMLKKAGQALGRKKESKCATMLASMGVRCFDNGTPTNSIFGVCTGRDLQGNPNGSLTLDNLMDTWVQVIMQGFNPDTIIMHPLTFAMFLKDPYLRAFALAAGGGVFFGGWTGRAQNDNPFGGHAGGVAGPGAGTYVMPGANAASAAVTAVEGYNQNLTSAPTLPERWPFPVKLVVSPLVRFDPRRKLADMIVCDSSVIGAIVQDEDPSTEEFDDPARDMRKIKVRERYALVVLEEGQGIAVMRDIHVVPNEVVLPAQVSLDVSGNMLGVISPTASVL